MTRFSFNWLARAAAVAAVVVAFAGGLSGAGAQDSSYIPIAVYDGDRSDFDVTVTAVPRTNENGAETVVLLIKSWRKTGDQIDTLILPFVKMTGITYFAGQRHANALSIVSNKSGNVTVNLPLQSYKNAEVALYTVNGKRVMSRKVSSSSAVNVISRGNVATGIYLLSVKGANSEAVTARLTHSGGGLSINAAFVGGSVADARKMAKEAADMVDMQWTVTVSAEGYKDNVFTVQPVKWNNPRKDIQLREDINVIKGTFTDERDGKEYKTVKIKNQTWMAENLNIYTRELSNGSWCYGDADSNCVKYGRLYNWETAKIACPAGWHLPTDNEWGALVSAAGGGDNGGKVLKSTSGWDKNGTDDLGFSALPGGGRYSDGEFNYAGYYGNWWTARQGSYWKMFNTNDKVGGYGDYVSIGYSVRCVEDE
ncbi:MAG: T9SS type A sorting domain-containing protein [Chitinispirillales bacterium]|jgi:uncharacterized protein (TIGR02145 family)|nr:T9SS type A sorting domain-containing protein [Chitinispirillales bacterium]